MNSISIPGRIGQDATTRQVGDTTVTTFSVADDQKVKGEKVTTWWNCSIWGARGQALEQYLTKGSTVCVVGVASLRQYEKNGEARVSAECKVSEIALLGKGQEGRGGGAGGSRGGAPQRERPQRATAPAPDPDEFADDDIPFVSNRSTF